MANIEDMPIEDFLRWLCMQRRVEEDGHIKYKSFRFGRSIWIIGRYYDFALAAMVSKSVIAQKMKVLEEQGFVNYVGLWTHELTNKGLETIDSKLPKGDIPSDYQDYVRVRKR